MKQHFSKKKKTSLSLRRICLSFILFTVFNSLLDENADTTARRRRKASTRTRRRRKHHPQGRGRKQTTPKRRRKRKAHHKKGIQRKTAPPTPRMGSGKTTHSNLISLRHYSVQFHKGQRQHNPEQVEGGNTTKKEEQKAVNRTPSNIACTDAHIVSAHHIALIPNQIVCPKRLFHSISPTVTGPRTESPAQIHENPEVTV